MMKALKIGIAVLLVVFAALVLLAPIGPMPGVMIGGTETAAPDAWPDTSDVHEIKLEVPGTIPRVVIIWVIEHQGELYVTGYRSSGWIQMLGNGGPVRMRLGDNTYPLIAESVTEPDLQLAILTDYMNKYRADYPDTIEGFPIPEEAIGNFALYHLSRSPMFESVGASG